MTTGALIFAQNNASVDYVKLAVFAASRIEKYLNIPVSLVTDSGEYLRNAYSDHKFDQVIEIQTEKNIQEKNFYDGSLSTKRLHWKNFARSTVYDLTPYDRTLVIDSDYVLNSNILKSALDNNYDFQIYRNSFDLAYERNSTEFERINQYSIPFYWATVFVFQKNTIMQAFFDLVTYIKENWVYFKLLYNINSTTFRNDYAFSIAIHIMNGKHLEGFAIELPGKMTFAADTDVLISADNNKMKFLTQKKNFLGEYILAKTTGLDVHVMNKMSLSRFIDGGLGV
jgi:hypothetical protein